MPDGTKPLPGPMLIIISEVLQHSSEGNFTGNAQDTNPQYDFENDYRQFSNISSTHKRFSSSLAVVFAQSIEATC